MSRSRASASSRALSARLRNSPAIGPCCVPRCVRCSDLRAVEVLERAARCWTALSLVARAVALAAVRVLGRAAEAEETELADLHARPERDRQGRDVRQLQGHVAVEAGVDEPR